MQNITFSSSTYDPSHVTAKLTLGSFCAYQKCAFLQMLSDLL